MAIRNSDDIPVTNPTTVGQIPVSVDGRVFASMFPLLDQTTFAWIMDNVTGLMLFV
jgi:hypothetical protein